MTTPKRIAVLGSTGSIGTQTLEVIQKHPEDFKTEVLTAGSNASLLIQQALQFRPITVVISDTDQYATVKEALKNEGISVLTGIEGLFEAISIETVELVLQALVGYAGLQPTLYAIQAGKPVALANKETLVVAGAYVMRLAQQMNVPVIPVDSEHSAIFQCLLGESSDTVEKIILTASGGPFLNFNYEQLRAVTPAQALKHPNWDMGAKITIDSATLMNKGLEAIEAKWLFNLEPDQIDIVVHPQSIIHSMVQFVDGSVKAQMGLPDMRLPILFALSYPGRSPASFPRLDFRETTQLNFSYPDKEKFPNLDIALEAMQHGGNMPCVMNAANEVAVTAFLEDKISFTGMSGVIEKTIEQASFIHDPGLEDYIASDLEARKLAGFIVSQFIRKI